MKTTGAILFDIGDMCEFCQIRFYLAGVVSGWADTIAILCSSENVTILYEPAPPGGLGPPTIALTGHRSAD